MSQKTVTLNEIQRHFLQCACNLSEAVLNFGITDKDFEEDYGYTKEEARKQIDKLYKSVK